MSEPQPINNAAKPASNAVSLSSSPQNTFLSGSSPSSNSFGRRRLSYTSTREKKALKPFSTGDIKILLLENINTTAIEILSAQGYQVESHKSALSEAELVEKIQDFHAIGIRSKTTLTKRVIDAARNLVVVGCFCIGTNQVDLEYAAKKGIAVFNSPFSNSRSVAELVIAEIITLARQLGDRSIEMHTGTWNKVSNKCWEIRGKTLGIVGYGHIGAQLSVLAEAMGMNVLYYDIFPTMALGSAKQTATLEILLGKADFVSLHVPELPETKNLMSTAQFNQMKNGSFLINASRGTIVDIPALIAARLSGKLDGFAIDVFPSEPAKNGMGLFGDSLNPWSTELTQLSNIILSPHIGGSTEEAQCAIGVEVANTVAKYINEGSSVGAVNFPEVSLRALSLEDTDHARVLYVHRNVPGVLKTVNEIFANNNIDKQYSESRGEIAYLMADVSNVGEQDIKRLYEALEQTPFRITTRLLY